MKKNNTVVGSAVLVMIVVLFSKFLGFLRQVVIATTYGSDITTDIYFLSSDFMIGLSGALLASLTTALVTIYIDVSVKENKQSANKVASKMLTMFLVLGGMCILIINIFAPFIARTLAPSYDAQTLTILIKYLRIFSLTFIFTAFQSIYAAVLNANNSFVPGKLYGIVYNPIAISFVLLFAGRYGIKALVLAYFVANIMQTLLLKYLCKNTFSFRPSIVFNDKNIKQLILLSLPLLMSNVFIQLNSIVDKSICSRLGEGFPSNYSYAYTLEQFITATITATVSLILLSRYATYVSEGNVKMLIKTFRNSLSGLIILLTPICVIAAVMSYDIVSIVYLRGEFDKTAAFYTSQALIGFCVGFGLVAIREMYIRLHFSYQDTKMPMTANILSVVLNAILSIILAKYIGILGVSLATSLSVILTIVILNKSVKRYICDFRFLSLKKLILKVFISGVLTFITAMLLKDILTLNVLIKFVVCAVISCCVYVITLAILRCSEFFEFIENTRLQIVDKFKKQIK